MRFFFYGTLIDADVRRAVLGPHAPARVEPARLQGWRRAAVPGRSYPVLVADAKASVEGVLAHGLKAAARRRLEAYEDDDFYELTGIEVAIAGRRRPVPAFVFGAKRPGAAAKLAGWGFDEWKRRHKRRFLLTLRRRRAAG